MKCPICLAEMVDAGLGALDQCGYTHLPARRFACPACPEGTSTWKPTGEPWVANAEAAS